MKKFVAIILVVIMMSMCAVYAAENEMVLTTSVPPANYMLNIPLDMEIPFGETTVNIGVVTVTESAGFAEGKNLKVTVEYDDFSCDGVATTIPISLQLFSESEYAQNNTHKMILSGEGMEFRGQTNGAVEEKAYLGNVKYGNLGYAAYADCMNLITKSSDWGRALAGEYSATITFVAEVIA